MDVNISLPRSLPLVLVVPLGVGSLSTIDTREGPDMTKLLRSKPVLIAGAVAIGKKIASATNTKKTKRQKRVKFLSTAAIIAIGSFVATKLLASESIRQKITGLFGKGDDQLDDWQPIHRQPDITLPESSSPQPSKLDTAKIEIKTETDKSAAPKVTADKVTTPRAQNSKGTTQTQPAT